MSNFGNMESFSKRTTMVLTKTYDGGSSSIEQDCAPSARATWNEDSNSAGRPIVSVSVSASNDKQTSANKPVHRQSRVSCEKHPSCILMDLLVRR